MARIIGGNPLGFFSGKMGGVVFAHNKGGQYVRQFVMPVDTKSSAQIASRTVFGQAVSAFHSLDPGVKSAWNVFAASYFNSKNRGNVPGLHSGVNAFVSLRNILLNMDRTKTVEADLDITINATPATAVAQDTIVINNSAPVTPMTGVLDSGNYSIIGMNSVSYNSSVSQITVQFGVAWNATPSAPSPVASTSSILTDGQGKKAGFAVYASNLIPQEGVFVQNPDIILLGNTGLIDDYTTASVVTNQVELTMNYIGSAGVAKNQIISGGTYRFQLYMFNSDGQIIKVGETTTVAS